MYGLKSLRENSPLCRPFGTRFAEILPGTPVPGYRLSRPFGTDCVGRPAVLFWPLKARTEDGEVMWPSGPEIFFQFRHAKNLLQGLRPVCENQDLRI
jgi:hypothetical protein